MTMTNWPTGHYESGTSWWQLPHNDRQIILNAITALNLDPADVQAIDFGDNAAVVKVAHNTLEAGRMHYEGHCAGQQLGDPCGCKRVAGESHRVCFKTVTVSYPA